MSIAYTEKGAGFPFTLLHAFPLSASMWEPNASALASKGFRVIMPDLRGFGRNEVSDKISTIDEMARDTVELLDKLNIERTILGGLSMGGYVSFRVLELIPERIRGLVLCDTNHVADTAEKRQARFDLIEKIDQKGSRALVEEMLPNLISDHTSANNQALVERLEREFLACPPASAQAALRGMAARPDRTELLKKINVPTLLVFGEADKVTNLETAGEMQELIGGSRLKVIPNAGHYSNLENPEAFNDVLCEFLENFEAS